MRVKISYFAGCREAVGQSSDELDFDGEVSVSEVLNTLVSRYSQLGPIAKIARVAVNHEFVRNDHVLSDGDELVLIPPVSGGSGARAFLTQDEITHDAALARIVSTGAGATITFTGIVRPTSKSGRDVTTLFYEAYEPMALKKMEECLREAGEQFPIIDAAIIHRLGLLNLGDVAVSIAVASKHRKEAFGACSFIIDRLKEIVPIWKKETGPDGVEWVSGGA